MGTADGKKFIELMKAYHLVMPVFPMEIEKMNRHGGPLAWSAFRAGQLDFLLRIESIATEYEQKVIADSQKDKKDKS